MCMNIPRIKIKIDVITTITYWQQLFDISFFLIFDRFQPIEYKMTLSFFDI